MGKKITSKKPRIDYDVHVTRMYAHENGNISFDCTVNGVFIYGMAAIWMAEKEEYFLSYPSRKGSDGKYYKYAYFPADEDLLANILQQIEKLGD